MISLSERDRRALLAGGIVLGALVLLGRGLPWWRARVSDAEVRASAATSELTMARTTADSRGVLHDSLDARYARYLALAPHLVPGTTAAAAQAAMAGLITSAARRSDVAIGTIQLGVDTSARNAFAHVTVSGDATGDVRGIATFLAAVERGPVALVVRRLALLQADPAAPRDHAEALHVDFTIAGLATLSPRRSTR